MMKKSKKKDSIDQLCIIRAIRSVWKINPVTRVKKSKKVYSRKRIKQKDFREAKENR